MEEPVLLWNSRSDSAKSRKKNTNSSGRSALTRYVALQILNVVEHLVLSGSHLSYLNACNIN
jgi:hypothetical protein